MRIFLSYASEDKAIAEPIAFSLRSRGHAVFLDKDDLPAGRSYDEQIEDAVGRSDVLVFLISPASVERGGYTLTELEFARRAWRHPADRVLPVMVRPTDLAGVPSFLKGVTILEPKGNITAEVASAVERLRGADYAFGLAAKAAILAAALFAVLYGAGWWLQGVEFVALPKFLGPIFGLALAAVLVAWGPGWSWRSLGVLVTLAAAFLALDSIAPGVRFGEPINVAELHPPSGGVISPALQDQIDKSNEVMNALNGAAYQLMMGSLLMLAVLLGALAGVPELASAMRWVACIAIGAATMVAVSALIGLSSPDLNVLVAKIGAAYSLWLAAAGGIIGYWIGRGQPT